MDINALVEIQLPTQPIPSYFFRIIKRRKNKADILTLLCSSLCSLNDLLGKIVLAGMHIKLLILFVSVKIEYQLYSFVSFLSS